jgi:hypothetical protein
MMKKLSLILAALLLVPAMAAVDVTVSDNADLTGDINYTADANVSAFAVTIDVDGGASIVGFTPTVEGESVTGNIGYGIFPGTIDINGTTGDVNDYGTPVVAVDSNTIIIEMGALYVDGNEPPLTGTLGVLEVDQACNVAISLEPIRGGIVYATAAPAALGTSGGSITGGTSQVAVPDVIGQNTATATATLTGAGLVKGTVVYQWDTTMAAGLVKVQNPVAGTMVDPGTAVALTISCRGNAQVDAVVNKADITALVNYIGGNSTAPLWRVISPIPQNDVNGDGVCNKADITALVNFIGGNASAPLWRITCVN